MHRSKVLFLRSGVLSMTWAENPWVWCISFRQVGEPASGKPILFSGPMVLALLESRKTQTRRVARPVRGREGNNVCRPDLAFQPYTIWWHDPETDRVGCLQECPHGKPGDRLWVREGLFRPDGDPWLYRADDQPVMVAKEDETAMLVWAHHKNQDYSSSMYMPRWASRITLEITEVRVQRVQEISEEDVIAEGVQIPVEKVSDNPHVFLRVSGPFPPIRYMPADKSQWTGELAYRAHYASLWDSLHAKKAKVAA